MKRALDQVRKHQEIGGYMTVFSTQMLMQSVPCFSQALVQMKLIMSMRTQHQLLSVSNHAKGIWLG
jgi:hypothetical protein